MELPCILIVDDEPINLILLSDLLKDDAQILIAKDGEHALKRAAASPKPDLILLDIMMPGMDGYAVCRHLKADPATADIAVIFVTALGHDSDETYGIELGAVDYLTKPISPPVAKARVRAHLALHAQAKTLERMVAERTRELLATRDATIYALASLAETRDNETGNHIRRTQHYVKALALALCRHPRFAGELTDENVELLFKSAPLHDIGKVGIPDRILLKPGKLTEEEFETMKTHTTLGRDAIAAAEAVLGDQSSFLHYAREIAYTHQEKWDGSGYPLGLAGEDIPLSGRLMALADVYDALISKRVYKPAFSHEASVAIIQAGRGRHFDPDIVDAFLAIVEDFRAIAIQYADHEESIEA